MTSQIIFTFVLLWTLASGTPLSRDELIVGGQEAEISDIPYIVSLQRDGRHNCGGTIIANNLIVTAAHCVYGRSKVGYTIRAGSKVNTQNGQVRAVADLSYHELYNSRTVDYDVAILRLAEPLQFNKNVSSVPLAEQSILVEDGAPALISGWGTLREGGMSSSKLQKVIVPVVNQEFCNKAYKSSGYEITPRMICAGIDVGGKDACQGDSGGPLVVDGRLTGVVSWGRGCARPGYPGVYARVSAVKQWLNSEAARMNQDDAMESSLGHFNHQDLLYKPDDMEGYLSEGLKKRHNNIGKIVGGVSANISDIPYIVSLQQGFYGHICGGTIVDKDIIITAAHCVQSSSSFSIRAGSNHHNSGGQTRKVQAVVAHENYSSQTLDYDVAVLKLSEPLKFGPEVAPAKLPSSSSKVPDGAQSRISGWGTLNEGGSVARELQTVVIPTISQESCSNAYKPRYTITPRMICAGVAQGGMDSCQGDSGGPLVLDGELVGAVSWGMGCARPGYPGVYARISDLRQWIDNTIAKLRRN